MSVEDSAAQPTEQQEIIESPLAAALNETTEETTPPTQTGEAKKSLRTLCKEKLKAAAPKSVADARSMWKKITEEVVAEQGGSCDRANVYKAVKDLDEEGFFNNAGTAPNGGTFSAKIPEVQITPLERVAPPPQPVDPDIVEPTIEPQPPVVQPNPQPPVGTTPQPYVFVEPDGRDVKAASDIIQLVCDKLAKFAKKPDLAMDDKEGQRVGRAVLILTAGADGRIDPRYIAGITVATSIGVRVMPFLPDIKNALTKKKPQGAA